MNRTPKVYGCMILLAGCLVYLNSLAAPFLFDDKLSILENARIRRLWPPGDILSETMRPVTEWSLAVNYALGGLHVWGYHALNLLIHLVAALLLFGIVRRTCQSGVLRERYGASADVLALVTALCWVVHPLQTQSVTYLSQRAESFAGMCALLTLYSVLRAATTSPAGRWRLLAVLACLTGMGAKPIMVTIPIVVFLYDRVFLAGSYRELLRQRWTLYAGLASSWVVLAMLLTRISRVFEPTAGFAMTGITWKDYVLTQPGVIQHYLKLALWPHPLVLDYWWPVARTFQEIAPPLLMMVGLVGLTAWVWRRYPAAGFLGMWLLLTLAPSSSVLPIADLAAEHRMYLPLASIVALVVFGVSGLLHRLPLAAPWRSRVACTVAVVTVTALAIGTVRRNAQYRSEESIWRVTVAQRPDNPRAHNGLASALTRERRFDDAAVQYAHALRLQPDYAQAHNDAGHALMIQGKLPEAITHLSEAVRLSPTYAQALNNLGIALSKQGHHQEANAYLRQALRLDPRNADVHYNIGNALAKQGAFDAAVSAYAQALRLKPDLAEAHNNWGNVLAIQGQVDDALTHYAAALRIQPHHAGARHNLEELSTHHDYATER